MPNAGYGADVSVAAFVQSLADNGLDGPSIAAAVRAYEVADEARKVGARERKRRQRERDITGHHVTSQDNAGQSVTERGALPLSPPSPNPPHTPQKPQPPHTPTRDMTTRAREANPFVEMWNAMAVRSGLKAVRTLTKDRANKLKARIAEHGPDAMAEAILAVERSPWCRGDNDRGWQADFDFILQPKSFNRLIEGSYERTNGGRPNGYQPSAAMALLREADAERRNEAADSHAWPALPSFNQTG